MFRDLCALTPLCILRGRYMHPVVPEQLTADECFDASSIMIRARSFHEED